MVDDMSEDMVYMSEDHLNHLFSHHGKNTMIISVSVVVKRNIMNTYLTCFNNIIVMNIILIFRSHKVLQNLILKLVNIIPFTTRKLLPEYQIHKPVIILNGSYYLNEECMVMYNTRAER